MDSTNPDYRILRVQNSSAYDVQRGAHRTKQVHFRHGDGTMDYVEIPLDQFTPENVQSLVEQATAIHKAVKDIQPGQQPNMMPPQVNPFG